MSVINGGTAPSGCRAGGRTDASAGSAGMEIIWWRPTGRHRDATGKSNRKVFRAYDHAAETVVASRVVSRSQFQGHLVLRSQVNRLLVGALSHVPEIDVMPVVLSYDVV